MVLLRCPPSVSVWAIDPNWTETVLAYHKLLARQGASFWLLQGGHI